MDPPALLCLALLLCVPGSYRHHCLCLRYMKLSAQWSPCGFGAQTGICILSQTIRKHKLGELLLSTVSDGKVTLLICAAKLLLQWSKWSSLWYESHANSLKPTEVIKAIHYFYFSVVRFHVLQSVKCTETLVILNKLTYLQKPFLLQSKVWTKLIFKMSVRML